MQGPVSPSNSLLVGSMKAEAGLRDMCTFEWIPSNQTRSLTVEPRGLLSRLQRLQPLPRPGPDHSSVLSALKYEADRFKSYLAVDVSMM